MTKKEKDDILEIIADQPWFAANRVKEYLNGVSVEEAPENPTKNKPLRTSQQNRSVHLWLSQVAEELDKNGHTLQNIVEKIQRAEIRPTKDNLKEVVFRPYMIAATGKTSTTKLEKLEVDKIYEGLNKWLGEQFEIHVPFPSDEYQLGGYKTEAGQAENYPEYDPAKHKPTI